MAEKSDKSCPEQKDATPLSSADMLSTSTVHIQPEPVFAAYATNMDITKLSNTTLNVMVAHRSAAKAKYIKCTFCGRYERAGTSNCSKCNTSLPDDSMKHNLLNEQKADRENNDESNVDKAEVKVDQFLDCCDKCMNNFVYGCIYLSIFSVLFVFPVFEVVNLITHWDNYGGCSLYFQYLLLSKLCITLFLYTLIAVHVKLPSFRGILSRAFILCLGMLLFFAWLITASIVFWGDRNFDHSHCNAQDTFTAGYYDFMYIEIMLVYAMFAFIISYFTWITIARHERLLKCIVYGQASTVSVCAPTAIPITEIIMLAMFWNNHGHCSDKFEWYILVKVVFMIGAYLTGVVLACYWKRYEAENSRYCVVNRNVILSVMIGVVLMFLFVWGIMAASMFFDKNAYDHSLCNHKDAHTTVYYDWMFVEIILNFALLYLAGNVVLCLVLTGYLCGKKAMKQEQNVSQQVALQKV